MTLGEDNHGKSRKITTLMSAKYKNANTAGSLGNCRRMAHMKISIKNLNTYV